jgi:iron(III) transport system ATP-binding protein
MLKVENLSKRYVSADGTPGGGVFGASFTVEHGEFFTLLGPSGCGKTTTLRSIAGLEQPDAGRISLGDVVVFDGARGLSVPMYDRDIGMVFQSYAIWPHLNVFENTAYPLRVSRTRKYSKREIADKVGRALEMVGLADFIHRPSTQLSGGQQQRLALARAFTREPSLLLLDEPLSNLDAKLREQMRSELKRLQRETGVTAIYVTHDQSEALALSDRIAVMNNGLIQQLGRPGDIYERPNSEFVASFVGKTNLFRGQLAGAAPEGGRAAVNTPHGAMICYFPLATAARADLAVVVRPEHIALAADEGAGDSADQAVNTLRGTVEEQIYLGEMVECVVRLAGGRDITVRAPGNNRFQRGAPVIARFAADFTVALNETRQV